MAACGESVCSDEESVWQRVEKGRGSVWRKGVVAMVTGHGSDGEWQRRHAMSDAAVGRYERGWIVNFS